MTITRTTLLDVTGMSVGFDAATGFRLAVEGVSLDVMEGETYCLIGESGSGKSTLCRAILRLVDTPGRIVGGSVDLDGRDLFSLSEREMDSVRGSLISLIPQDPMTSLNPMMKVGAQVAEALRLHGRHDRRRAQDRAIAALDEVGVPRAEHSSRLYPHELSGGLRQRVAIAIATVCRPKLVIADEPTTALDVTRQAQILELLKQLQVERGLSVLFVTHDLAVAREIADHIGVMYAGRLVETGPAGQVLDHPAHPYTQALVQSVLPTDGGLPRKSLIPSIKGSPPSAGVGASGCRFAPRCPARFDACDEEPPLFDLTPERQVRCWLYEDSGNPSKRG
jgi:oligopeptide/dipeptide ABC transporter ATP-binding protein